MVPYLPQRLEHGVEGLDAVGRRRLRQRRRRPPSASQFPLARMAAASPPPVGARTAKAALDRSTPFLSGRSRSPVPVALTALHSSPSPRQARLSSVPPSGTRSGWRPASSSAPTTRLSRRLRRRAAVRPRTPASYCCLPPSLPCWHTSWPRPRRYQAAPSSRPNGLSQVRRLARVAPSPAAPPCAGYLACWWRAPQLVLTSPSPAPALRSVVSATPTGVG